MDLKQLKYFLTVVDERQITAAARKLHMAQPPLSQQMKLLESELGTELVKRGPHHIELTDAGRLLTRRAQQLLALADSTSREIADLCQGLRGTLAIGTISSSGSILWHPGLQRFQQQYRDVHFEIYDANTYQLIERQLIIYRRFNQVLSNAFTAQNIQPEIYCRNDDARTTILWANAGLGIAITPASAANLAAHEQLHIKKIDEPSLATRIAIIWRRDAYLSNLAEKFLAALNIPADGSSQPLNQEVHLCPTKK